MQLDAWLGYASLIIKAPSIQGGTVSYSWSTDTRGLRPKGSGSLFHPPNALT